ncbi:sodium-dependent nutrient amino acid transporter 1 [Drosophila elegans]|uniref:sodium-dependent nutrient amino acid transporter 1 n=1 Tax=Drosophila elegans TaxID=30023 RepID=UPI0007E85EE3|nr:sodium-dependent nutrient amino acid transporter 1 [Drosophila elegans]XP_017120374.1 sodium-dependent nutrient amino acid transporter 1 [Drosophila elegans]XP_017120375.1 sodium-dependent nutrient amino acid transporter 1 [Drosophila elegans]XP_017120376.1 sodium-dependent nutrient amino acid transporter 1 [Drosophila elegans]
METTNNNNDNGYMNPAFVGSLNASTISIPGAYKPNDPANGKKPTPAGSAGSEAAPGPADDQPAVEAGQQGKQRASWNNDIEFLMSCIALSVGLGNVWRFPFTALENGGGAFVIPYLIVLVLVGKPVYYLEMLLGQFSSRGSVKVYDFSPIMRGIGYGQVLATGIVTTYYATLMALTLRYFVDSFYPTLPWSYCRAEWGPDCLDSGPQEASGTSAILESTGVRKTSAEFYFINIVLREKASIDDGIGYPSWSLALALAVAWVIIAGIMFKGVKSSGKASYFLALFPYVVMFVLLVRALSLPGAFDGVLYFLRPQWHKLLEPQVWYAAVTQVFFSLAICFGNIIMYASYNRFGHNIYRDANIVTTLDTFTSLLSGVIIFGILGNLAHENNTSDIASVVKGGPGLAFISYPDAIAKFKFLPQLFSVLFFLMLFVLGIGSNVGMASCLSTVIKDQFGHLRNWTIVVGIAVVGYLLGLLYLTPGGQFVLNLLDYFGVTFVALVLAIFELVAIAWVYGVKRLCRDVEFMIGIKTSLYYRICWAVVTPLLMLTILVYTLVLYEPLKYNDYTYQSGVYVFGWCLTAFGVGQVLFWAIPAVRQQPAHLGFWARVRKAFEPLPSWGPADPQTLKRYQLFVQEGNASAMFQRSSIWHRICDNIFG